ncbi:carotenoid biosynthesis protein [Nonomuraea roseola]|uniref:Carotenoid biosynthesis protein n=2 Tax=Nonomuraea TaxID=83681 RepID=A0ABV5QG38_9ACTN
MTDVLTRRRTGSVAGALLLSAMVAAQVGTGLQPRPIGLTSLVVILLALSSVAFAAAACGLRRAVSAFASAAALGYGSELLGVTTGVPFGDYAYTAVLQPQLFGVPVIVPLAWAGMGLAAYAVARGTGLARIGLGAVALTAWDLFLDPQMIRLGLWAWEHDGPYRGVPLTNFAGWLVVSFLMMALIHALARDTAGDTGLVTVYTVMAVMETLGFALVFQPPDPLVAACGGVAMGAFAVLAWRRRWQR